MFIANDNRFLTAFILQEKFAGVDIRVRVNGGGHVSQIYAIRQAISKALVSYYQKCEYSKSMSLHASSGHWTVDSGHEPFYQNWDNCILACFND